MNKAKSTAKPSTTPVEQPAEAPPVEAAPEEVAPDPKAAPLSTKESARLLRINAFLVKIADPSMARARARARYTDASHREGWQLYRVAAGEGQALAAPAVTATGSSVHQLFQHLDEFENKWFPRTRRIIERFAPMGHAKGLAEAFFKDLQQQPLGPRVVGSVSTFLDRVEALATSNAPGAATVHKVLAERGVDEEHIARLRATLDEARKLKPAPPAAKVDPTVALRARRTAYDALWLWWKDWREAFHSEVDGRQRRELGLVDTALGARDAAEEGDSAGDEGENGVSPPAAPVKK